MGPQRRRDRRPVRLRAGVRRLGGHDQLPGAQRFGAKTRSYFLHNHSEVRALSFFHLLAAIALLAFSACLYDRLRSRTSSLGMLRS